MALINSIIFISILCTIGYFYSFFTFMSDYEENKCEMTYMFQYPQFVVSL